MKKTIIGVLLAIVALLGGYKVVDNNIGGVDYTESKALLNSVSASTTSSAIDINGAKRVTLFFKVASLSGASGQATSTFVVTTSVNGTDYVTYNKLIDNVTNTNAQNLTRVASEIIDSNTSSILSMDLTNDIFKFMKVTDTITGTTTSVVDVDALIDF